MSLTIPSAAKNLLTSTAVMLLLLLSAAPARASTFQTFVSFNGNDANTASNCVRTSPCRLIKTALTVTSQGGVLTVLDSAGFGGFTVTQSVQVVTAPGVQATIVPIAPNPDVAVLVNAPGANVTLRGLYLASPGPGSQIGIRVDNVGTLHVESCVVAGFASSGMSVEFAPASGAPELYISDTVFRECANGIIILNVTGVAERIIRAVIERVRIENCSPGTGVAISNNVESVLRDSVVSGNGHGLSAFANFTGIKAEMLVENCLVTGNSSAGITAHGMGSGTAVVDVEGTTIAYNGTGLQTTSNGFINSRKDNTLRRNTTDGAFSTTFLPL